MGKVETVEAPIYTREALCALGENSVSKTSVIIDKIKEIRGSSIAQEFIVKELNVMYEDGEIERFQSQRLTKKGLPFSDDSKISSWKVIDFETFEKTHRENKKSEYVQAILN